MDHGLAWAVVGLVLVIAELLTGTFYLVMLGVAAFGAAGAAYLGVDFSAQVIVAALVAAIGCYGAHVYRTKNRTEQMPPIDAGNPARFESWIDARARLARVDLSAFPHVKQWLTAALQRPAAEKAAPKRAS